MLGIQAPLIASSARSNCRNYYCTPGPSGSTGKGRTWVGGVVNGTKSGGRSGTHSVGGAASERFAAAEGFDLARVFVEIETGKGSDALDRRPQLAAALNEARRQRCAVAVCQARSLEPRRAFHFGANGAKGAVCRCRAWARR
jgi:hypothetical protein